MQGKTGALGMPGQIWQTVILTSPMACEIRCAKVGNLAFSSGADSPQEATFA